METLARKPTSAGLSVSVMGSGHLLASFILVLPTKFPQANEGTELINEFHVLMLLAWLFTLHRSTNRSSYALTLGFWNKHAESNSETDRVICFPATSP